MRLHPDRTSMTRSHGLAVAETSLESQIPVLLSGRRHEDARGWFIESYNARTLAQHGVTCDFVQDNHSMSRWRGTIRGLSLSATAAGPG
jgi:dTDP-4-dehydrorhamnose 3,5-epimerase